MEEQIKLNKEEFISKIKELLIENNLTKSDLHNNTKEYIKWLLTLDSVKERQIRILTNMLHD